MAIFFFYDGHLNYFVIFFKRFLQPRLHGWGDLAYNAGIRNCTLLSELTLLVFSAWLRKSDVFFFRYYKEIYAVWFTSLVLRMLFLKAFWNLLVLWLSKSAVSSTLPSKLGTLVSDLFVSNKSHPCGWLTVGKKCMIQVLNCGQSCWWLILASRHVVCRDFSSWF